MRGNRKRAPKRPLLPSITRASASSLSSRANGPSAGIFEQQLYSGELFYDPPARVACRALGGIKLSQ